MTDQTIQTISQDERRSRRLNVLLGLTLLVLLLILWLALSFATTTFWTSNNMSNLLRQGAMIAILAIGETFTIITGGIDLSVGAIAGFISMTVALLLANHLGFASSVAGAVAISLADRRLDRPLPRLRRHADGSAPVHHDAGDDVRAARHRLSHHQRRDDFGRQRRLHRLLARELPRLSLDGWDVVRDAGAVLDGPRRRSPSLYPPHQVPLGAAISSSSVRTRRPRFSPASTSRR